MPCLPSAHNGSRARSQGHMCRTTRSGSRGGHCALALKLYQDQKYACAETSGLFCEGGAADATVHPAVCAQGLVICHSRQCVHHCLEGAPQISGPVAESHACVPQPLSGFWPNWLEYLQTTLTWSCCGIWSGSWKACYPIIKESNPFLFECLQRSSSLSCNEQCGCLRTGHRVPDSVHVCQRAVHAAGEADGVSLPQGHALPQDAGGHPQGKQRPLPPSRCFHQEN